MVRVVRSNLDMLKNKSIKLCTDNNNLEYILDSGSNVDELHNCCLDFHELCSKNTISFVVEWIPRKRNVHADYLSRLSDCDDWSVTDTVYGVINQKWGPHTVDRFSSHYNNKCARFNSRWWVPGTEATNCFYETWKGEINWLVPPPSLGAACIRKLQDERSLGTVVLPEWPSAAFWPLVADDVRRYKHFVKEVYVLPKFGSIMPGRGNNGIFGVEPLPFRMLALFCDCRYA